MAATKETIRLAAIADLHYTKASAGSLQALLTPVSEHIDILLLCGDLTDYGLPEETQLLVKELNAIMRVPIVAVLGNHDYESGKQEEVTRILTDGGIRVLNGDTYEVQGIGFAGVKGFAGGFGRRVLSPWGEEPIKRMVREAIDETLKLESALAKLRTPQRIALLHYAPIRETVEGEPLEIFPFLGCSRLEEPINRYPVTAVYHGHAHHGHLEGQTQTGIPVYNVSMSLLQRSFPDRPPVRIDEYRVQGPSQPQSKPVALRPDGSDQKRR
jgi:Icc-related predicted phosphoesterase